MKLRMPSFISNLFTKAAVQPEETYVEVGRLSDDDDEVVWSDLPEGTQIKIIVPDRVFFKVDKTWVEQLDVVGLQLNIETE